MLYIQYSILLMVDTISLGNKSTGVVHTLFCCGLVAITNHKTRLAPKLGFNGNKWPYKELFLFMKINDIDSQ